MPITISGMASGMDTDAVIEKLVNVESRPIRQLEIRKKNHNSRKDGLNTLGRHLNDINDAAKDLFGFRASYTDKNAVSSDSSVLDAKATNDADKGVKKIKVIQIASSHRISTDPMEEPADLPAGKFKIEVNGGSAAINFKGGKLKDLKEKIDESASGLVTTSYILKSGHTYILTIQSNRSGAKGEIKLTGDKELLSRVGFVDGAAKDRKSEIAVSFDSRYFTSYLGDKKPEAENGNIKVGENGASVTLRGLLWREYALPVDMPVKEDTRLEFDVSYLEKIEEGAGLPRRLKVGPKETVNIKGIILEGYNIDRKREDKKEEPKSFDGIMGIGVVAVDNGKRKEKIYALGTDARGGQSIDVGRDFKNATISKIILYCNRGVMNVSNVRIATPEERKDWLEPKNVIALPQDARITVDGIEVTRDRNDDLTDVIKGISLNLKRPSSHEIDLTVEHSIETSVEKIRKFVDAYNKYLDYNRQVTKAAITKKPGDFDKVSSQSGLLVGDMILTRLQGTLQTTVNSAYPNNADQPIKMLTQIGVSTGAINAEWESIKSGKLIVDEAQLKKAVMENPDGVAAFFGSDTDGDNKPDNGMAFKVVYVLKPYVTPGKNIIAAQIEMEDNSIKLADEGIKRHEEHLKKYEEKLRVKFARMERAISETNAQKQWMRNQLDSFSGGGSDNKKDK
ncbi:MAG: hypothetical protein A2176_06425 [Spirochaetes bacterium RBG_13_51_14]|nr:MAG: hypothetical protein A2176_06425 [Spirochaetes bacterium RBG_13_51_14]